ncbi:MAG: hypothetical protein K6G03_12140 [Lachnospiraceae bacterium]|nr:hypothetical protein [Lachnospiraceae bacterium]
MLKQISSKTWIILLYAAFHLNMMACSIYTDSRTGYVWDLYRIKELAMVAGFLCFYVSRKLIKEQDHRKYLFMAVNIIYSVSLLFVMISDNTGMIMAMSIISMYTIGYLGGAVYYYMSLGIAGFERAGLVVAIATTLAYLMHYLLWVLLGDEVFMVVVMVVGFSIDTYIVVKPKKDWIYMDPLPYVDKSDVQVAKRERISMLILIALSAIAMICIEKPNNAIVANYSDLAGSLYGVVRLSAIPTAILIGCLYDKKKHELMTAILLLSVIIRIWLPEEYFAQWLFIIIYSISEVYIILFITISFWEAAPETDKPELWASFGRVLMVTGIIMEFMRVVSGQKEIIVGYMFNVFLTFFAISIAIMEILNRQKWFYEKELKGAGIEDALEQHVFELAGLYNLTPRETDVVRELLNNPESQIQALAEHLGISRTMFYRYMNQLYEKTGTSARAELVEKLSLGKDN